MLHRSLKRIRVAAQLATFMSIVALSTAANAAEIKICGEAALSPGTKFVNEYVGTTVGLANGHYTLAYSAQSPTGLALPIVGVKWNGHGTVSGYPVESKLNKPNTLTIYTGLMPPQASPGERINVNFQLRNYSNGQLVASATLVVYAVSQDSEWERVWTTAGDTGIESYTKLYPGDFDGDGAEEILGVDAGGWMTLFHFDGNDWQWGWSNYGDPDAGGDIYSYRNQLTVGDFNGDDKDELLGSSPSSTWLTTFHFDGDDWHWGWSNYGNNSAGGGITPYRNRLLAGDFDGDGKDEVLGVANSLIALFNFDSGNWQLGWSNYGNTAAGGGIYPYRNSLRVGQFDDDAKDEVIGLSSWATVFHFDDNDWRWGWSTNGAKKFAGWGYPLESTHRFLIGDIDGDPSDEVLLTDTGASAKWATTVEFVAGSPTWSWSTYGTMPFIDDWSLSSLSDHFFVRAVSGDPKYLFARRSCRDDAAMFAAQ